MFGIDRERVFQGAFWGAALLYVWVIAALWIGPELRLSGDVYFFVGIVPAVLGVVLLATAMGVYHDLLKEDER